MARFIIGIDLGQTNDFTAVTVLEQHLHETGRFTQQVRHRTAVWQGGKRISGPGRRVTEKSVMEARYELRYLERFPLGTPYPKQVEQIQTLYRRLKEEGNELEVVVDQTGVGRPVLDMLRAAGLDITAVTITGGNKVSRDGRDYRTPKRDLVSTAQVLLQTERLRIAASLPLAQALIDELLAFKVTVNDRGHDSYGNDVGSWRENPHDDMVLATALAAWWGELQVAAETVGVAERFSMLGHV